MKNRHSIPLNKTGNPDHDSHNSRRTGFEEEEVSWMRKRQLEEKGNVGAHKPQQFGWSSHRTELGVRESALDHSLLAIPIDEGVDPRPLSSSSVILPSVFSCLFSVTCHEDSVYQYEGGGGSGFVWMCHSKPRECIHDNRSETSFRFFPNARSMKRTASRWYGCGGSFHM